MANQPNSKPEASAPTAPTPLVQKEVAVAKEGGTIKPVVRNELKPAKHNDVVQGIGRERR